MGTQQQPSRAWATYEAFAGLRWNGRRDDPSPSTVTRPTRAEAAAPAATTRRRRNHGVRTLIHRMLASTPV
ncbi:hypothetical protein [Mumia sp. Pv 4-285]|uniref:hypothetical protein n=1 Tax=Mumia qirimensis TaxID=3234852 RepID=UPI00351D4153